MTGNKFRTHANDCIRAAYAVTDPERRLAMLDVAARWNRLAREIEATDARYRRTAAFFTAAAPGSIPGPRR